MAEAYNQDPSARSHRDDCADPLRDFPVEAVVGSQGVVRKTAGGCRLDDPLRLFSPFLTIYVLENCLETIRLYPFYMHAFA